MACVPAVLGVASVVSRTTAADNALREAVTEIRRVVPPDSWLVARKPHIPHYSDSRYIWFPMVESWSELQQVLAEYAQTGAVYLFYGRKELQKRPQFSELMAGNHASRPWLKALVIGSETEPWVLYRYESTAALSLHRK
jgi:hypothetical protein